MTAVIIMISATLIIYICILNALIIAYHSIYTLIVDYLFPPFTMIQKMCSPVGSIIKDISNIIDFKVLPNNIKTILAKIPILNGLLKF
jgi:hypothetical protein